jgi:hypothetical protein
MTKLVSIKEGELFLSYSGHGASIRDKSRDEKDGCDETIVPLDFELIVDDDLRKILVEPLSNKVKLTALFDCCHSGSGLDLKYNYVYYGSLDKNTKRYVVDIDRHYQDSKGQVILFSGCADPDYSADTVINNRARGAMTAAFLSIVKNGQFTYLDLLVNLRKFMKKNGYLQVPQLSSGKSLNLNEYFHF